MVWGKQGFSPEIFVLKCCRFDITKIFFIRLESLCTIDLLVRSEDIARGSKA